MRYLNFSTSACALSALLLLFGCGGDGDECRVESNDDGSANILCADGSTTTIPRSADGTPPDTCKLFEDGDQRFVRCGTVDYPIGSTTPLCPSGYFEGDLEITVDMAEGASALERFELSGCTKLRGTLTFRHDQSDDSGGDEAPPALIAVPESLQKLTEIVGGLNFQYVHIGGDAVLPNLVKVSSVTGDYGEGIDGMMSLFSADAPFPALKYASRIGLYNYRGTSVSFPELVGQDPEDDSEGGRELFEVSLDFFVGEEPAGVSLPKLVEGDFYVYAQNLQRVDLPNYVRGRVGIQVVRSGAVFNIKAANDELNGDVWVEDGVDFSAWENLWPAVEWGFTD